MNSVRNEKGEWVIPASKRPDGTWRKERVLKEGYVPQDEIGAFQTRASKGASAKKGIPGLPPPVEMVDKPKPKPKATDKPKDVHAEKSGADIVTENVAKLAIGDKAANPQSTIAPEAKPEADPAKKLKALNKKLREITEIETKQVESLTAEQVEKLGRKSSILAEIESLSAATFLSK